MNMKKILAGALASVMAVSSMAVFASADDSYEYELAGQLDVSFNEDVGEWPAGATGTAKIGDEVTITWDLGDTVKLAGNYLGLKTKGVAWSTEEGAENPKFTLVSLKADDRDVHVDTAKLFCGDNDSAAGNLKVTFMNEWDENTKGKPAVNVADINGEEGFQKLTLVYKIEAASAGTTSADATDAPEGTTAAGTQKPAGNTDVKDPAKGDAPNTGIEGVAVVAGLAVLAAGAIVVAKKRK